MNQNSDEAYFARWAQQELDLAGKAADAATKTIHLDLAAAYATRRELAACAITVSDRGSEPDQPDHAIFLRQDGLRTALF